MNIRRLPAVLVLAATVVALGGCRNPFNPKTEVRCNRFYCGVNFDYVLQIRQTTASNLIQPSSALEIMTMVEFANTSSVRAKLTSYIVVYRKIATGLPIAEMNGAAGLRFPCRVDLQPLFNNAAANQEQIIPVDLGIITHELITYIASPANTDLTSGGIDCEITFFGEDEHGYDLQVDGTIHIEIY